MSQGGGVWRACMSLRVAGMWRACMSLRVEAVPSMHGCRVVLHISHDAILSLLLAL